MGDRKNTEKEFNDLYESVFPVLYRVSLHVTSDTAVAEEICQDAFIKYNDKAPVFHSPEEAKYWLIRVVKNMSLNYLKRKGRERAAYEKIYRQPVKQIRSGEEEILLKETADLVRKTLAKLPDKLKSPLILKEFGDLNYKEIAKVLKITESNVKVRIFRARGLMAQYIDQEDFYVS